MLVVNLEVNGKLVHHLAVTTVVTDKALVKKYVKILGVTRVNQLCIQKMQGSGCLTSVNPLPARERSAFSQNTKAEASQRISTKARGKQYFQQSRVS